MSGLMLVKIFRSLYIISPLLLTSIDLHDIVVYMNCRRITGRDQATGILVFTFLLLSIATPHLLADETSRPPGLEVRTEAAFRAVRDASLLPQRQELRVTEQAVELTTLEVISNPDAADVFLDGRYLGRTPLVVRDPGLGTRTLQLSRDGYQDLRYQLSLREGIETRVDVRLLRRSGYLVIDPVSPKQDGPAAQFILNGELLRGGVHELPVGNYQLQVRRFGFRELRSQISIHPDVATTVRAHLEALPFVLTGLRSSTHVVNPDDVGRLGEIQFRVEATAPGVFLLRIHDAAGQEVYSVGPVEAADFTTELRWDGTSSGGQPVADGTYLVAVYELSEDPEPGAQGRVDLARMQDSVGAAALSTGFEVNRNFRVRMRSPFSVQAGTGLVPGLELLPPRRVQFAGAVGYHAGSFQSGSPEYYPGVMQVRVGLPARLELGAAVGGQFYDDPEFHRYYATVGLVHRSLRTTVGPFRTAAGLGLRGTLSDSNQEAASGRPDPFGASSGIALSFPMEIGRGAVYLRAAPEFGSAYPRPAYVQTDSDALLLFFAARVAVTVDIGYISASLSYAGRSDLEQDPFARALPDTVLAELQMLIPGTVAFIHASAGLDYLPGKHQSGFATAGLGVLY